MADRQWLQNLQLFLSKLLQPVITNPETRKKFLTPDAMRMWVTAFTHETVSPTDNYEDIEFSGDTVLKWAFPKYLKRRFPFLNKGELTELHSAYMSKMHQAQMSQSMGLTPYIRVTGMDRANLNLDTDVFESFFGTLEKIGDSILDGSGTTYCYNMIVYLYKDTVIDIDRAKGSTKTQVQQMFTRFDLAELLEQSPGTEVSIEAGTQLSQLLRLRGSNIISHAVASKNKTAEYEAYRDLVLKLEQSKLITVHYNRFKEHKGKINFTVTLRPEHIKFLASYGVTLEDNHIGYGEAPTKKEAEQMAYDSAFRTLGYYGINTKWAEEAKRNRDFANPEIAIYDKQLTAKYQKAGYNTVYFFIPRKTVTSKGSVVELVGVRPNGVHEVLTHTYATERDNGYSQAKILLVKQYLGLQ